MPLCKLCDLPKELKHSHVIGKSVFKKLNKSSGKHYGILTDQEEDKIIRSTDQWATVMLCNECENLLNSKYENYSLWVLKNKQNGVRHLNSEHYLSIINVNQSKMILYVLSIFWRAAVSDHKVFKYTNISPEMNAYLKNCILNEIDTDPRIFSIKVSKLKGERRIYSQELVDGIITNISPRLEKKGASHVMIFMGYLFEIFIGSLEVIERFQNGVLRKNKKILRLPFKNFLDVPELFKSIEKTREIAIRDRHDLNF